MPHPKVTRFRADAGQRQGFVPIQRHDRVEVWRDNHWQPLDPHQCTEFLQKKDAGNRHFTIAAGSTSYAFNLDEMSLAEGDTGKTSVIRFSSLAAQGFETVRQAFKRLVVDDVPREQFQVEPFINEESLFYHWPGAVDDEELLRVTAEEVFQQMTLTNIRKVNMAEWIHYWALRLDDEAPMSMVADINARLRLLLQYDPKVLQRLQLLFELAAEPEGMQLSISQGSLLQVCQTLLAAPSFLLEQELAREVLDRHASGQSTEESDSERLLYHDFLNIMLGRQRHKVYIWMYDITNGRAQQWSWLGAPAAFWHTAVVVDFPEGSLEFWYGGRLYMSKPGTTPFGQPMEKRFMGHCYKSLEEVENYISYCLAQEFLPSNYDSLMHNCNHFSDRLLGYLAHQRLPHEILHQPEMILNSTAVFQLLRPLLNRWLGRVEAHDTAPAAAANQAEDSVPLSPLALVSFQRRRDGGLQSIGRVEAVEGDHCVVSYLDFWRQQTVELPLPQAQVTQILGHGRARFMARPGEVPPRISTEFGLPLPRRSCCWLPVLLPDIVSKPSATSFKSVVEEDPVHVANF